MGMRAEDYETCTSALAALRASSGSEDDVKACIAIVLPLVRKSSGGDKVGAPIAQLLRVGQVDRAQTLLDAIAGRGQPVPSRCPGCRGQTAWQSAEGCPECGYKQKSLGGRVALYTVLIGPFIALMMASAGAAIVPSSGALAAPLVCGSGEAIVTTGHHFQQPDGTSGTNYTSVCNGPNGTTPVSTLTMLGALFAIYLVPSLLPGAFFAYLFARRLRTLGR